MAESTAVERSIWVAVPPERAWQAVTEPQHLNQWYATFYHWDIPALAAGARVEFYNKDNHADMQVATITVVDPPREFTLRWESPTGYPATTLITSFLLNSEADGTRVTIHESGYETVPADERQQWLDATGNGYGMSVENLKAYLEGRPIPY
ncbi:MAG: SRPBCC domain-containing protein [Chloroflexi bacterium]|nr:SRPBCC domain-containing protein [Chloroflexota bacterium]MCC6897274.1 SRPBCC domain-containing protein [Anaerolineae bacterium]